MAATSDLLSEKQFLCSLCLNVFTDPVTTPCGHNFCKACIQGAWDSSQECKCPSCEKAFMSRPEISINVAFKEIADMFQRIKVILPAQSSLLSAQPASPTAKPGDVVCDVCASASVQLKALKSCLVCLTSYCEAHLEPHQRVATLKIHKLIDPVKNLENRMCRKHERLLEMFCRDDQLFVCQFCTETDHKTHQTVTIEEEGEVRKVQMKETEARFTQMIQDRQNKMEEIKQCVVLSKANSKREMEGSGHLFASLMRVIEKREAEVNEEIEEKQQGAEARAQGLINDLQQEVTDLQTRNAELEKLLHTEDHLHLLQRFPALSSTPPTREWSEISANCDVCIGTVRTAVSKLNDTVESELDNIKDQELKRMQVYAVDVVLDRDTAHPNIILSADGKQASRGDLLHLLPDLPQRFDPVLCVLGSRGFLSGRFYFQVMVGSKTFWDLGVVRESVNRKGMITSTPEHGYWTIRLRGGDEYRALESPSVLLHLQEKPQTIGVFVDIEEGRVSFFNVKAKSHIYSFTGCRFSDRLFPFLSPSVNDDGKNAAPLVIMPINPETLGVEIAP